MRFLFHSTILICLIGSLSGCSYLATKVDQNAFESADIAEVTRILDDKLVATAELANGAEIKLTEVTIDLKTVVSGEDSGGFGVLVFSAGVARKTVDTSSITVVMNKFEPVGKQTSSAADKLGPFVSALNKIIQNASNYKVSDLSTNTIAADIHFVVEKSTSVGAEKYQIKPITLSYNGSLKLDQTNKITLKFKRSVSSKGGV